MANIVYPTLTGWVGVPPYPRFLHANEPWAADDPFVKEHPELFADAPLAEPRRSVPVEQATAAPGERRAPRATRSTRTASDDDDS